MDFFDIYLAEFKEYVSTDAKCQSLWAKVKKGAASYRDAENYSARIGKWWSKELSQYYSGKSLEDAVAEIEKSLHKAYSDSAYYAKNVQTIVNSKARIGMKAVEPAIDESRILHLLEKLETEPESDWLIGEQAIENITRSAVTDTIRTNARVQSNAGLHAYIKRDSASGCCAWCDSIAGTYEFGDEPDDFWRVHKDCSCSFEYKPSRTRAVEHIRYITNANGTMTKETTIDI